MDVVVKCAKNLYNKRYAINITKHLSFIKWLVLNASFCWPSCYIFINSWHKKLETFKMWCLISQPNSVIFEVRCDPKAIGQECLEKVSNKTFFNYFLFVETWMTVKFHFYFWLLIYYLVYISKFGFICWLYIFVNQVLMMHAFFCLLDFVYMHVFYKFIVCPK